MVALSRISTISIPMGPPARVNRTKELAKLI